MTYRDAVEALSRYESDNPIQTVFTREHVKPLVEALFRARHFIGCGVDSDDGELIKAMEEAITHARNLGMIETKEDVK